VLEGEVAVCNMGQSFSAKTMGLYQIATKGKNEVLGAISFLDGEPYAVSFIAKTPLTVAVLDFSRSAVTPCSRKLRDQGGANATGWTDGAEQIGPVKAPVAQRARAGATPGPNAG
jgi:hypothetical protein